jgi:hypothetical protein
MLHIISCSISNLVTAAGVPLTLGKLQCTGSEREVNTNLSKQFKLGYHKRLVNECELPKNFETQG